MIYNITAATESLGVKIIEEALRYIDPEHLVLTVRNPEKANHFQKKRNSNKTGKLPL